MARHGNRRNPVATGNAARRTATRAVIALVAFLSWANPATAGIAPDKVAHAEASFAYGVATGTVVENRFSAFALAMAPGLAKEILDSHQPGNYFSWGDLAADAVGAGLGVCVGHAVFRPTRHGIAFQYRFR